NDMVFGTDLAVALLPANPICPHIWVADNARRFSRVMTSIAPPVECDVYAANVDGDIARLDVPASRHRDTAGGVACPAGAAFGVFGHHQPGGVAERDGVVVGVAVAVDLLGAAGVGDRVGGREAAGGGVVFAGAEVGEAGG